MPDTQLLLRTDHTQTKLHPFPGGPQLATNKTLTLGWLWAF